MTRVPRGADTQDLLAALAEVAALEAGAAAPSGPRLVWDRDAAPEIQAAQLAAAALRAVLDGTAPKPKITGAAHADARPKFYWWHTYAALPGLTRITAGSTRANTKTRVVYTHALLPEWEYLGRELPEMLEDLENLAAGKGPPKVATRTD
jgi:hypothetical protein